MTNKGYVVSVVSQEQSKIIITYQSIRSENKITTEATEATNRFGSLESVSFVKVTLAVVALHAPGLAAANHQPKGKPDEIRYTPPNLL